MANLRNLISEIITENLRKPLISECVVAGGQAANNNILAKTRDRNYKPKLKIVRELYPNGTEVVFMYDGKTKFLEGMNSHGIGILNSTLMVYEDENPLESGTQSSYGDAIIEALLKKDIQEAMDILGNPKTGVEGHTYIGSPEEIFIIERTGHHDTILNRLDPAAGFSVRTNHGIAHKDAGYTFAEKPDDYKSSKIRKSTTEMNLKNVNSFMDVAPAMLSRSYKKESNFNTFRRTDNLRTSSQVVMNLPGKEFLFYIFPNECDFSGIEDNTPDGYEPLIKIKVFQWNEK